VLWGAEEAQVIYWAI